MKRVHLTISRIDARTSAVDIRFGTTAVALQGEMEYLRSRRPSRESTALGVLFWNHEDYGSRWLHCPGSDVEISRATGATEGRDWSMASVVSIIGKLLALSIELSHRQAAGLWSASLPRNYSLNWLRTRLFNASSSTRASDPFTWSDQYATPTWSPMSSTDPIRFESTANQQEDEFHTSLVKINDIHLQVTNNLNAFRQLNFSYLDLTAPMRSMSWKELTATFIIMATGEPFRYWDFVF